MGTTTLHRLGAVVAGLAILASAIGLLVPTVYRDNPLVTAGWRGTDLVTLTGGVPLLALSIRESRRGSLRWHMVLMGILLYAFYNYAFYLFGAAFNALFLVYVGLMIAAGAGLLVGATALDADSAAAGTRRGTPRSAGRLAAGPRRTSPGEWRNRPSSVAADEPRSIQARGPLSGVGPRSGPGPR